MQNRLRIAAGLFAVSAVVAGCSRKDADDKTEDSAKGAAASAAAPTDTKAAENEIRALDSAYFAAVKAKDASAIAALYTDDAVSQVPNAPALKGHDGIVKYYQDFFKTPQLMMTGGPDTIKISDDGTMAYDAGTYSASWADAKGKIIKDEGKYLEVLKKVDGKWKVVEDANNSNMAPPK